MRNVALYPTFRFQNAEAMITWLQDALGFEILTKHSADGQVSHCELALGSAVIMCGDNRDDAYGAIVGKPGPAGGRSIYLAVDDIDSVYARAKRAGATIAQDLVERDYGSREFICSDPEGNVWCFGTYRPTLQGDA